MIPSGRNIRLTPHRQCEPADLFLELHSAVDEGRVCQLVEKSERVMIRL